MANDAGHIIPIIPKEDLEGIKSKLLPIVENWPDFRSTTREQWDNIKHWFTYIIPTLIHAVEQNNIDKDDTTTH